MPKWPYAIVVAAIATIGQIARVDAQVGSPASKLREVKIYKPCIGSAVSDYEMRCSSCERMHLGATTTASDILKSISFRQ
jgi:hypothetical protein